MSNTSIPISSKPITSTAGLPVSLPLLVTTGEPAGIGMDIVLQLAADGAFAQLPSPLWVTADATAMRERAEQLLAVGAIQQLPTWQRYTLKYVQQHWLTEVAQTQNEPQPQHKPQPPHTHVPSQTDFILIDVPCRQPVHAAKIDTANASMVLQQLALAHTLASRQQVAAIITGPLQKSALVDAGLSLPDGSLFSGHTEYFMQRCGCDKVVMMLANAVMKVALVTTHLPLRAVADAITADNVATTVQIVLDDLRHKFAIANPKIRVCGLNPHAGEGGHLGKEEIEIINPVLAKFRATGVDISEALPADTLFTPRYLQDCDVVIAMYHDQGLPVLKSHGFGDTVNLTLGLPYVRTSVDHGTALDLAATGRASASSLQQAMQMAVQLSVSPSTPIIN